MFFFKQKTAYEMRISDWSSDVCSSDLPRARRARRAFPGARRSAVCRRPSAAAWAWRRSGGACVRRDRRRRSMPSWRGQRRIAGWGSGWGGQTRKSVVEGKRVLEGVDLGGLRLHNKKSKITKKSTKIKE